MLKVLFSKRLFVANAFTYGKIKNVPNKLSPPVRNIKSIISVVIKQHYNISDFKFRNYKPQEDHLCFHEEVHRILTYISIVSKLK